MLGNPMKVNREALERWCNEIPRCRIFFENFFLSSEGHPLQHVRGNFKLDLGLYRSTNKGIRENWQKMPKIFKQITGEPL